MSASTRYSKHSRNDDAAAHRNSLHTDAAAQTPRQQPDTLQHSNLPSPSTPLIKQMHRQQRKDIAWLEGLRQHHQENQLGHKQVMSTVAGSHSSTARMRQLAQAEVDWTCFRSAVEPGTRTYANQCKDSLCLPDSAESASSLSLAGCSPRAESAVALSPRSCYSLCSPGSPSYQDRPYTTPTVVSPQPFHNGTECPLFVSSLYSSNQRAKSGLQTSLYADSAHSMAEEGSFWSGPLHGSSVTPMPQLKSKSGGVSSTFGSRQRDRPDSSSSQVVAELPHKDSRRSNSTSELISVMREGGRPSKEPKALGSLIVNRSNAWPESSDGHPVGSGLTARQQACLLGKCTLAKHEEKLADKYGPWLQDLKSVWPCSPLAASVQRPAAQADATVANADEALAPKLYSMGPI